MWSVGTLISPTFQQLGRRSSDRCRRVFNPSHRLFSEDEISPRFFCSLRLLFYMDQTAGNVVSSLTSCMPFEALIGYNHESRHTILHVHSLLLSLAQHVLQIISWVWFGSPGENKSIEPFGLQTIGHLTTGTCTVYCVISRSSSRARVGG